MPKRTARKTRKSRRRRSKRISTGGWNWFRKTRKPIASYWTTGTTSATRQSPVSLTRKRTYNVKSLRSPRYTVRQRSIIPASTRRNSTKGADLMTRRFVRRDSKGKFRDNDHEQEQLVFNTHTNRGRPPYLGSTAFEGSKLHFPFQIDSSFSKSLR